MARLIVSTAVALAVTYVTGSPQAGFAAFSATYGATGFLDPAQKSSGPRLDDLKGTTVQYGTPIPHVYGHPRVAGAIVWCSDKQTVENTESVGGKGGPSTEVTTYTYKIDLRVLLTANVIAGVRRIWSNGKLVWSAADDADAETLEASADTDAWERMTIYTGAADQMPDPVEEAALGIANCPAYRGRGSVFIEGLNLGGSGYLPNLTFEVVRTGEMEAMGADILLNFNQDPPIDVNEGWPVTSVGTPRSNILHLLTARVGLFGIDEFGNAATGVLDAYLVTVDREIAPTDIEISCSFYIDSPAAAASPVCIAGIYNNPASLDVFQLCYIGATGPTQYGFSIAIGNNSVTYLYPPGETVAGQTYNLRATYTHSTNTARLYVNTVMVASGTYEQTQTLNPGWTFRAGFNGGLSDPSKVYVDDAACRVGTPGFSIALAPDPLEYVLSDLSQRSGLDPSYLDFSSCEGQLVRALAVSQVTPARSVMQMLGDANMQEFVESGGVLKTVARGGASVASIAYEKLGASQGDPVEPLPLKRLNDIELPRQVAITYSNTLNDYQNGTEYSDRLLGGSTSVATTELSFGMEPQEAKRLADFKLTDAVAGITQIGPLGVTREFARLEPTDVITPTDHTGSTFRARILKITDDGGLRTLECVLDDASAVNSEAVTDEDYESSTIVRAVQATELELIDAAMLRDADNVPMIYAAVNRSSLDGTWPGAALFRGVNDTGWSEVARYTDRTFIGVTTTELPSWSGGWLSDESSSVTVSGVGTLQSYTDDAILNGTAAAYLIGSEILYARTATLVSDGVYTLTGLYRGRRGTEWAAADGAAAGSRVVLLQASGLRRVDFESGQLGAEFDFGAVTLGKAIGSATTESITPMGIGLKPFAPVHVEADSNGDGTYDVTWQRRTRMSCRFGGSLGINTPLGEASESYAVEVFDGASVTSTQTVSAESATVTASPGDVVRVYQVSAIVGRGYVAEVTL